MVIPLSNAFKVFSFRIHDFEADLGVIPSEADQKKFGIIIVELKHLDRNYLLAITTKETKSTVLTSIFPFLNIEKK